MKKLKKQIALAVAVILVSSAFFTGCSKPNEEGGDVSTANDVIKIGVFEPLTGENSGGGAKEMDGIKYAHEMYPEVLGKEVQLVVVDNKSNKEEAKKAVTRLIEEEGVVAMIGSYGSSVSIAASDVIKSAGVPTVGASCTNPMVTQGNDYYFRTCYLDPFQGTVMANYAIQNGAKTASVITQNGDDYSVGLGNYFKKAFVELTGNEKAIVSENQFQTNEQDFNTLLTNVKAANADVIFAPSSIATAPLFIKQARVLGIEAMLMGGDTWENPAIIEVAGDDAEGIVFSTFFDEKAEALTKKTKKFITGYNQKVDGKEAMIPAVAALGYDSYIVLLDAIERAGSTDKEEIRQALADTKDFEGVTGFINFDENGDAKKNIAIIKTVKDGKFIYKDIVNVESK